MTGKYLLGLFMAGLAAAQTTVTSMVLPDFDAPTIVASIMGNDATATTYSLTCSPLPEGDDCGMGPGLTMVAKPTTTSVFLDEDDEDFHYTILCSVGGTTTAVCTETATGTGANDPGEKDVSTYSNDVPFVPVTITAGSITGVASASSASTTSTGTSGTTSAAESKSTEGSASSSSATGSTSSSTGGMPQMTGDVKALFGGAAVAIAAAFI